MNIATYGPSAPGTIATFLSAAVAEMATGLVTPARFIELRYDMLNRWYPHEVFSNREATHDFFATTLAYVTGARGIPDATADDRPYHSNYLDWCRLHARLHNQK